MEKTRHEEQLLGFFKALADANRLKIVGLLAKEEELTVEELAALLDVRPSTVSHHLSRLAEAGLVSARAEGYYSVYRLETAALEAQARQLLSREALEAQVEDVDLNAYDRKVVENFLGPDGRFRALPSQQKKYMAVLRYILQAFEPGRRYAEREVNDVIARYHEDTAGIRRGFIEYGMMAREGGGGAYWRTDA